MRRVQLCAACARRVRHALRAQHAACATRRLRWVWMKSPTGRTAWNCCGEPGQKSIRHRLLPWKPFRQKSLSLLPILSVPNHFLLFCPSPLLIFLRTFSRKWEERAREKNENVVVREVAWWFAFRTISRCNNLLPLALLYIFWLLSRNLRFLCWSLSLFVCLLLCLFLSLIFLCFFLSVCLSACLSVYLSVSSFFLVWKSLTSSFFLFFFFQFPSTIYLFLLRVDPDEGKQHF